MNKQRIGGYKKSWCPKAKEVWNAVHKAHQFGLLIRITYKNFLIGSANGVFYETVVEEGHITIIGQTYFILYSSDLARRITRWYRFSHYEDITIEFLEEQPK